MLSKFMLSLERSKHFWTDIFKLLQLPGVGCTLDLSAIPITLLQLQGIFKVVEPLSASEGKSRPVLLAVQWENGNKVSWWNV